ncbi:MAG: ACP S-malonyltransferase, partial [Leptospirales bacterium]
MESLTVVFPGQGSQYPGMGRDFHATYAAAREVFDTASQALGEDIGAICFESDSRLNLTEYTQPCILATEIAMYRSLEREFGFRPDFFAGHSLGEYAALVAADVMPLDVALRVTKRRGGLMQQAVPVGQGAMAALLMDDIESSGVADLIREHGVEIANRNSPHQLVISGAKDPVFKLMDVLEERLEDMTVVPLNVSAPFHSGLMRSIEAEFKDTLLQHKSQLNFQNAGRVFSNYTGERHTPEALIDNLVRQISRTVHWTGNMQ